VGASLLGNSLRGAGASSAAAEAGLSGVSLLLQRGMTTGATGAATATTGLSRALAGLSGLTAGGVAAGLKALVAGLGAATLAAAPLVIALAAIVPAVVGYNKILGESRQVTATAGKTVADYGEQLKKSGVQYRDFGKQGGPVQEALNGLRRAFDDAGKKVEGFSKSLGEIPVVGPLAKAAFQGLIETVKVLTGVKLFEWAKQAADTIRLMYAEASKNQAIVEATDQSEQFQEQLGAASDQATAFTEKLKGLNSIPPTAVQAYTEAFNKNRQVLADGIVAAENLKANYESLATAAREKTVASETERQQQAELVAMYETLARSAGADIKLTQLKLRQLEEEGLKRGLVADELKRQEFNVAALTAQIKNLNAAAADTGAAVQVGQALLSYGQELANLEQSRFNIAKARGQYELQQAQEQLNKYLATAKERGASDLQIKAMQKAGEAELEAIRQQNRATEQQALQARYAALVQEQQLQQAILVLTQEEARLQAQSAIGEAEVKILQAKVALKTAEGSKDAEKIAAARLQLEAAQTELVTREKGLDLLNRLQPLERLIADVKGETARNGLIAEGAAQGMAAATMGTVAPTQAIRDAAAAAGYQYVQAADGTWQLAQAATNAANATDSAAQGARNTSAAMDDAASRSRDLSTAARDGARNTTDVANAAGQAKTNLDNSAKAAGGVKTELGNAGKAASNTADEAGKIGGKAADSATKSKPLVDALKTAGTEAQSIATANMAGNLTKASGSAGGIRDAMVRAAGAAREFYNWLAQASGLPGSRWTGGPVAAGQTVRINDGPTGRSLGQESFLTAAGKLTLINRPANSLWTAPTSGTVIPAGITKGLKERGMFDAGRTTRAAVASRPSPQQSGPESDLAATVARQALAIGKLQQSVDRLVEKDWNVHLRVRNDGNGASYLNMLSGMG
jgi:hypothetical protein